MRRALFYVAASLALAALPPRAIASAFDFSFSKSGVSGSVALTYGSATDATYSQAFEVTGITGTFSDANAGIKNAAITGLAPVNYATPEPGNLLTPADFSRFFVASGTSHGSQSYDNLLYPGGSPQTATSYPFHGGFLDIYGLLFGIGNGEYVNIWSNGVQPFEKAPDYGVAVVTSAAAIDSVGGGISVTPEPGTLYLLGTGLLGALLRRRL